MKILVLNARGLNLAYLGCYGCAWVATPNVDRLAAEGVVFDQHFAEHPQRVSDRGRSTWTGRHPIGRIAGGKGLFDLLQEQDIAVTYRALKGWDYPEITAALEVLSLRPGLVWLDCPSLAPPWDLPEEDLQAYFPEAEEDEDALDPWRDPPTGPVDCDGPDLERLQNTYAAVMTHFDAAIGKIRTHLENNGLLEQILVCVTAAGGLALGEHGVVGEYRAWLHEEVAHVPLLLRLAGAAEAGRHISALTQPVDLFATLLEAFALPAPPCQGFSLWPLLRGEGEQVRDYAVSCLQVNDSQEWALRTRDWAFLLPVQVPADDPSRLPRLFVKPDDRWEVNDVRQQHLEWTDRLEKTLRDFVDAAQLPGPLQAPPLPVSESSPV